VSSKLSIDVRRLPEFSFEHRMPIWWGTVFFMVIEGSAFLMTLAAYAYLASQNPDWPLSRVLPDPRMGALLVAWLLASEVPNFLLKRRIKGCDVSATRLGMLVMSFVGLVAVGMRLLEFSYLKVRWDADAFGSMIWALIFLHTTHIVVDVSETLIMTVMSFHRPLDGRRFVDLEENAQYWDFVVLTWIPVYVAIYWVPRWMIH
jgi:heme/copper-type cytochrome/quinol oxidase subunit 3